jgi:hypothetical protein
MGSLNKEISEVSSSNNSRDQSVIFNLTQKKSQTQNQSKEKKEPAYQIYNDQPVYPAKYTDSDNSEDEGMEDYKVGGYHPVHVG